MLKKDQVTPEILSELLRYDSLTGKIFWRERTSKWFGKSSRRDPSHTCAVWNSAYAGKEAFTATMSNGYKTGTLLTHNFLAHRVAWALFYGKWPNDYIDHINGIRSDNRIDNLRDSDQFSNMQNSSISKRNKSGVIGVFFHKASGKWAASIRSNGKNLHLGLFCNIADAIEARKNAEESLGFHKNHGKKSIY